MVNDAERPGGREDFDFVAMDNYQADMKETADRAAGIIEQLRKENRKLGKYIASLVLAAGGEITIPWHVRRDMSGDREATLTIFESADTMAITVRAELKPPAAATTKART